VSYNDWKVKMSVNIMQFLQAGTYGVMGLTLLITWSLIKERLLIPEAMVYVGITVAVMLAITELVKALSTTLNRVLDERCKMDENILAALTSTMISQKEILDWMESLSDGNNPDVTK
jgi:hypothetical protein